MRTAPEWATNPIERKKFDRNNVEIPRYQDIESGFSRHAQAVVEDFSQGRISKGQAYRRFDQGLVDAETDAFVAGRRARGSASGAVTQAEAEMLAGRHARNMKYFAGFLGDIESGRGRMGYSARAELYARSLWSLYTRSESADWNDQETANARYYWVMDPDAEHCRDCRERAAESIRSDGFTWERITELGWPGDGNTICRVNCRCHVRSVQKKTLLPERYKDVKPAASASDGIKELQDLLGGEKYPIKLPVAGLPFVDIRPEVVERSLSRAIQPQPLAQRLPLLPQVLTMPELVVEATPNQRLFIGQNLQVMVQRSESGLWSILWLALYEHEQRRAA